MHKAIRDEKSNRGTSVDIKRMKMISQALISTKKIPKVLFKTLS